jgi:hypothetical protein
MKCSKQLSVEMPWGKHTLLNGFLDSNVGKLKLKTVSIQHISSQVTHIKTCRKFANSSTKTDKVQFWRLLTG